jgi:ribosomal protein L12E/L44/L45/RPP1/RPP2
MEEVDMSTFLTSAEETPSAETVTEVVEPMEVVETDGTVAEVVESVEEVTTGADVEEVIENIDAATSDSLPASN